MYNFLAVNSFRVSQFPIYLRSLFWSRGHKAFDRLGSRKSVVSLQNSTIATKVYRIVNRVRLQSAFPTVCFTTSSQMSQMNFISDKEKYLKMPLESKRAEYQCGNKYVTLASIPTWKNHICKTEVKSAVGGAKYSKNNDLNGKISLFVGDITALEIDAIVNAANTTLRGGGGVDGAIHRASGKSLLAECITLDGCQTGEAKITGGYKLPAKYVIHTVGPVGEKPDLLKSCYEKSLAVAKDNVVRSIAFPCISTGVYRYPNENAAYIAIKTAREWLDSNPCSADRIIFCLFMPVDIEIYERLMPQYFPR